MEEKEVDQVVVFEKKDLPVLGYPVIEHIRRIGKLCDVTLKVDGQKFSAHKLILAASIPYFHAMFTNDMVESRQNEISIQGIEAEVLEALINFAYNGKVQISINNVQSLLVGASFLQLHEVKEACCDFLNARLHPSNCLGIRSFADTLMCADLVTSTNKFIEKHFVQVSKSEEFPRLDKADIVDITARDDLNVSNEEQVFEAVLGWVKHDEDGRKTCMPELLARVRLPLLTPQYLTDHVSTEELIRTCHRCRDLLDEAKDYHLMPERRALLQSFRARPRCCTDVVGVIYAVGGLTSSGDSLSRVESFDPIMRKWVVTQAMSTMRSRVGVGVLLGKLYAIGGYNGLERLATVEMFDSQQKQWKEVAPMKTRRSALGAVALDRELFVCGGYDGVSSLNSVECYNPAANTWTTVSPMAKNRSASGVTVLEAQMYVLGGHDGLSIFNSVECYNKMKNKWTSVTPMLTKRCRLGVASLNGKIYACGGYDGSSFLRTVERFDAATQSWTLMASMNVKRSRVALVANLGKLYAIGGYDGVTNLSSVEVYDPLTDSWEFQAPMCAHVGGVGVGVVSISPPCEVEAAEKGD